MSGNEAEKFSIAPMMGWSTRHARYFWRGITPHARLYTEMITANALIHNPEIRAKLLAFTPEEEPLTLQLGGSEPDKMAQASIIAQDFGYQHINLNIGCPSAKVRKGAFGACLFKTPEIVAALISAIYDSTGRYPSIKTRIGVDDHDQPEHLWNFVKICRQAGTKTFIIHARKAWLDGLNPKQNRTLPPLQPARVYELKQKFPDCHITINGGIDTLAQIDTHLQHVDGVMIGRAAWHNPWFLRAVDAQLYPDHQYEMKTRHEAAQRMVFYYHALNRDNSIAPRHVTHPMLALFKNCRSARNWRRILGETGNIRQALQYLPE